MAKVPCDICGVSYERRGLGRHRKKCVEDHANAERDAAFLRERELQLADGSQAQPLQFHGPAAVDTGVTGNESRYPRFSEDHSPSPPIEDRDADTPGHPLDTQYMTTALPEPLQRQPSDPEPPSAGPLPKLHDIKTEYHPLSEIPTKIESFEKYSQGHRRQPIPPEERPWEPFRSRLDFEISELALEAALNRSQVDRLIKLIRCAMEDDDGNQFTIQSSGEMKELWEQASVLRTPFEKKEVSVMYKNRPRTLEVQIRDLWDWAMESVYSSVIAPRIVWDAVRQFRWNGTSWEQFVDEPWTARAMWDAQSNIPKDLQGPQAKILAFILYADKTKLSSFGTAKGYPIIARFGNLPHEIRNSDGVGGGRVVGWLPIVPEETAETGKTGFVNFKNAVWHTAFRIFLEKVASHSKSGSWTKCGDEILRCLFPIILILSADYEEMSVMSLIRGIKGLFPCPVCLVPQDQLFDLSQKFEPRTQTQSAAIFNQAQSMNSADAETLLKEYSLRPVENAFWTVANTDLHRALSYDTLHFDDNGLFEDHFFKLFKNLISTREDISKIDNFFDSVPRWRGLNHFSSVMNITFNDGSKNRDISKIFLYAGQTVLSANSSPAAYLLLRCLRSYLNIRMYADFDLHTQKTISAGRQELAEKFMPLLENYIAMTSLANDSSDSDDEDDDDEFEAKSWNFPKLHLRDHLFDDIEDKGVTRNFSTKPNEKMHGPLKFSYKRRSNFKKYGDQILQADHFLVVAGFIRSNLDALDQHIQDLLALPDPEDENATSHRVQDFDTKEYDKYRELGSPVKPCTFRALEEAHKEDRAFNNFRIKLGVFLTRFLPQYDIPLPHGNKVQFSSNELVTEYRYLKVQFACTADWHIKTDYLRCNPSFYGHPRYDCVLVDSKPRPFIARIIFLFTCVVDDQEYPLALIQPFADAYMHGNRKQKDIDLELLRFRQNLRGDCEFVSIHSFIRGAVLVHSGETASNEAPSQDYFLFDVLDPDMFLRARELHELASLPR